MPLTVGSRVGPYQVLGLLGTGGMGEVFRVRDERLGRDVALKVLPEDGRLKILDFGLARQISPTAGSGEVSKTETRMTDPGTVLGKRVETPAPLADEVRVGSARMSFLPSQSPYSPALHGCCWSR